MDKIYKIYQTLYKRYGAQGWWPFINYDKTNSGYHKLNYNFPRNQNEVFEVCLGSILTQNTTFKSVVKSLHNLNDLDCINSKDIESMDIDVFKEAIRPSGYFNQKAKYILEFIKFFHKLNGTTPRREELLKVLGVGEETADSILLYGYNKPQFVVDAYTKRVLIELDIINPKAKYKDIKELIENSLKNIIKDENELVIVYQEYHALIVEHSKKFYSKKPYGVGCFLKEDNL